ICFFYDNFRIYPFIECILSHCFPFWNDFIFSLTFEVADDQENLILVNIQEKINKLEPDVTLKNKADGQLINMNPAIVLESQSKEDEESHHEWLLEGIDCANCAAKIENGVAEIDGVINSNVNYMTQTLSFDLVAENDAKTL